MKLDTFTHAGRPFAIVRNEAGKALRLTPCDGLLYSPDECDAALAAYLADAGDFASVRAAITGASRATLAPAVDATVTTWRAPPVRANAPVPAPRLGPPPFSRAALLKTLAEPRAPGISIGDEAGFPCPSCDGPMVIVNVIHDETIAQCPRCAR